MDAGIYPMLLAAQADERGTTTIAGERHAVTFAFFGLASASDPTRLPEHDDAYLLIDDTMRRLVDIVYAYEGMIERFTPDGFVALFGVPVSHENDPERAVRAILDMQIVAQELVHGPFSQHWGIQYRGIVHTSQVEASNITTDLDIAFVTGDNITAVLDAFHQAGPVDTIIASATTQRHIRTLFDLKPLPPIALAGDADPIECFGVEGLIHNVGTMRVRAMPMIGRRRELQDLQRAWEHMIFNRKSQWVILSGEAGVGKTRLLSEFQMTFTMRGNTMHCGSCMSHMRHRSLSAIADLLRDMLGLASDATVEQQSTTFDLYIERAGLSSEDSAPFLRSVLGLPQPNGALERRMRFLDPAVLQRQTHAALRQVLVAHTRIYRSIFVLEDIQWLDTASQAFIEYLLQSQTVDDAPLMMVLVARAGIGTPTAPLIDDIRAAIPDDLVEIQLESLTWSEQNLLLAQLLPLVPEADLGMRDQLTHRAHGNPLYLEQIVQMLIDRGAVERAARGWLFTPAATHVVNAVPATIHALMLARFNLLAESLRRLLQKAALCRMVFPKALLRALHAANDATFEQRLAELEARAFLVADLAGDIPTYSFNHMLLQEVVYDTLLVDDRQTLHDLAAAAIGAHDWYGGYERVEALAYHFTRGTEPVRAVPFLIEAADHAAQRSANGVAIAQFEQALDLMHAHPSVEARFFAAAGLGLGRARKFAGAWGPASDVLQQTLAFVQSTGAPIAVQVQTLCEIADVRFREGAQEEAVGYLEQGRAALERRADSDDDKLSVLLADRLGVIRFRQGRLDEAFTLAHEAVRESYGDADDPLTLASLYNTLGGVCWQQGRLAEAIAHVEQSRMRYEEIGYSFGVATALMNLGILLYTQGEWQQAAEYFERSDKLRRDMGYVVGRANNLLNLALLRMAMGDHELADSLLRESLMVSERLGDDYGVTRAEIGLGHLAIVRQQYAEAAHHLQHAEALLQSAGEDETVQVWTLRALTLAHQGQLAAGLALANEALTLARTAGVTEQEGECLRAQGTLYGRAADDDAAEAAFDASLAIYRAADDTYQASLTLLERARLRRERAERDPDGPWLALSMQDSTEALACFTRLGAHYDREQALLLDQQLAYADRQPSFSPAHGSPITHP